MNKGRVIEEAAIMFERDLPALAEKRAGPSSPKHHAWQNGMAKASIEPREGGKVELMGGHIRGVITGWRPHQFLAHTWNVFQPGETVSAWPVTYLEFALAPRRRHHAPHPHPSAHPRRMQPQTMMGWHTFLDMLETAARGEEIKPRGHYMQKNAALYGVDLNNLQR